MLVPANVTVVGAVVLIPLSPLRIFSDELWQLEPADFAQRSVDGLRRVWAASP